jgi:hypothetical protein
MKRVSHLVAMLMFVLLGVARGQAPELLDIGPEEQLGPGRIPAIAADSRGQPHVVADGGSMIYLYDRIGAGWRSLAKDASRMVNAPQFYNPAIEIDSRDRAWISGVTWLPAGGIGVIVRENMSTNPSDFGPFPLSRAGARYPVGLLSIDPAFPDEAIVMGSNGGWQRALYQNGSVRLAGTGTLPFGAGGEKTAFWISKAGSVRHADGTTRGVWHGAMGGYYGDYSAYINSLMHARGERRIVWANYPNYPTMKDDGSYVRVVSDALDPEVAYITCDFSAGGRHSGVGIGMNIYNGQGMNFPPNNILILDREGTAGIRRLGPQSTPAANGGVFVVWTRGGRVKMRYVPPTATSINDCGPEWDIAAGGPAAVASDEEGNVHIAYNRAGTIFYRLLEMSGGSSGQVVSRAVDFDGDGVDDIAVFDPENGGWHIRQSRDGYRNVSFGVAGDIPVPGYYENTKMIRQTKGPVARTSARKANVAVFRPSENTWYIGKEDGSTESVVWGVRGDIPVPADYDADGIDEIAIYRPSEGNWIIRDFDGQTETITWGLAEDVPVPGNYNGTLGDEVAVFRPSDLTWYIRNHGNVQWGIDGDVPVPADYDGDGTTDIAIFRPASGEWIGWGSRGNLFQQNWGAPGDTLVPGDYDGDGKADLAVFRAESGFWYVLSSQSRNLLASPPLVWGVPGDVPVPGDYDQDGFDDVAVFRASTGNWHIRWSSGGSGVINWGAPGDIAAPGDFDGDGNLDLAVFRPRSGIWFIRQSQRGFLGLSWGVSGDWPVAADYDGDGTTDIAVFRPATGNWHIRKSTGGSEVINWGAPGDWPLPADYNQDGTIDLAVFRPSEGRWLIRGMPAVNWGAPGDWPITGLSSNNIAVYRASENKLYVLPDAEGIALGGTGSVRPFAMDYDRDNNPDAGVFAPGNGAWWIRQSSDQTYVKTPQALNWSWSASSQPIGGLPTR